MRRTLSALALTALLAGCGTSLPYHGASFDESMGMTIEQYAVGRLPATRPAVCPKPAAHAAAGTRTHAAKRCRAR